MGTSVIRKEELIDMLEVINNQLENLELSMMANRAQYRDELNRKQEMRIKACGKQLNSLEMKVSSIEECNKHNNIAPLRLKLSY